MNEEPKEIKPGPLTVESFALAIDQMIREGRIQPDAKILVQVEGGDGFTGAETLYDFVTIGGFGKRVTLTPFWRLAQHFDGRPNQEPR